MVFGSFLSETLPNCCRVFSSLLPGYYGLSLSVDLLRVVALAALTLAPNLLDKTPAVRVRISPSTQRIRPAATAGPRQRRF